MKSYLKLFVTVFFILAVVRTVKADFYTISGKVRYADNNEIVTSGRVDIYDAQTCALEGTGTILPTGDYLICVMKYIQQGDVIGLPNVEPEMDWVPTGYPDKTNPDQYTRVTVDCNLYNIDIYVQRMEGSGLSPMVTNVSGLVLDNNNKPVSGAIVYATRGGQYFGYGISDSKGNYKVKNIPTGDFILIAHKIAHQSDSKEIIVNENELTDVNFVMGKSGSTAGATVPSQFSLSQNFPNPFNPSTTINYSLALSGMVSLKVYNSVGQEVASLVNEFQEAGNYTISFNPTYLSSGIYYYRLSAGSDYNNTKRMTLIK